MQINCPCGKTLRVGANLVGKRVQCPSCGEKLQVLEVDEEPAAPPKRVRDRRHADEDDSLRRRRPNEKSVSPALWLALGVGGLAIVGIGVVLVLVLKRDSTPAPAAAPTGPPPVTKTGLAGENDVEHLAYSADGRLLATVRTHSPPGGGMPVRQVAIWDLAGGRELGRFESNQELVSHLEFSPDGSMLAVGGSGDIRVWDVAKKGVRFEEKQRPGPVPLGSKILSFSPDSKSLVSITENGIVVIDPATGVMDHHPTAITRWAQAAHAPNDTVIAIAEVVQTQPTVGGIRIYNYRTRRPATYPEINYLVGAMAYSRDGKSVVLSSTGGPVYVYDAATWKVRDTYNQKREEHGFIYYDKVALSLDGSRFFGVPMGPRRPTIEAWTLGHSEMRPLTADLCRALAVSPDGKTLAAAAGSDGVKFYDPATGEEKKP